MKNTITGRCRRRKHFFTIIVCVDHHLQYAQPAAGEVEQHIADAPSVGALSAVVHVCLRHIFDQCDAQFDVTACVEEIEPVHDSGGSQYDQCEDAQEEDGQNRSGHDGNALFASLKSGKWEIRMCAKRESRALEH